MALSFSNNLYFRALTRSPTATHKNFPVSLSDAAALTAGCAGYNMVINGYQALAAPPSAAQREPRAAR